MGIKEYVDLRIREMRLNVTKSLSVALAGLLSSFLLALAGFLAFGILSYFLMQVLNASLGTPWGTVIVLFISVAAFVVLFLLRKKLFLDGFVRLFSDEVKDSRELDNEILKAKAGVSSFDRETSNAFNSFKSVCGAAGTGLRVAGILYSMLKRKPCKKG